MKLLIKSLFVIASLVILSCNKGDKPDPYLIIDPIESADTPYISITSAEAVGSTIHIYANAVVPDRPNVWIDWNNNGKWDRDIDQKITIF